MGTFLKLALLSGDDFALLLGAESIRRRKKMFTTKFDFDKYTDIRCITDFRFTRDEIFKLIEVLRIPNEMRTPQGVKFLGAEGKVSQDTTQV